MTMKYCQNCGKNVDTERSWSTVALVLLILFLFPIGIIYAIVKRKRRCPICRTPEKLLQEPKY